MSNRLDQDKEAALQPERMKFAKEQIEKLGYTITFEDKTRLEFIFRNELVKIFPYSGWCTGKSIVDGRGIHKLLNQIKI